MNSFHIYSLESRIFQSTMIVLTHYLSIFHVYSLLHRTIRGVTTNYVNATFTVIRFRNYTAKYKSIALSIIRSLIQRLIFFSILFLIVVPYVLHITFTTVQLTHIIYGYYLVTTR